MFGRKTEEVELKPPERAVQAFKVAFGGRLVSVVLFGPQARGEGSGDSDWDLLVIADGVAQSYWERDRVFHQALSNVGATVSVVGKTREEFESYLAPLQPSSPEAELSCSTIPLVFSKSSPLSLPQKSVPRSPAFGRGLRVNEVHGGRR